MPLSLCSYFSQQWFRPLAFDVLANLNQAQSVFYNITNICLTQIIFKFNNKVEFCVHINSLGSVRGSVYFGIPRNHPLFVFQRSRQKGNSSSYGYISFTVVSLNFQNVCVCVVFSCILESVVKPNPQQSRRPRGNNALSDVSKL